MSEPDWTEYRETAEQAARAAAQVLADWAARFTVSQKANAADLVTEADFAAQRTIHAIIAGRYPDHNFLGEEGLSQTNSAGYFRWVIDPLDGTANYVHGNPYYCVSIALEYRGALVVGVVHDPGRDEMFSAVRGGGTACNGRPVRSSAVTSLGQALVAASFPHQVSAESLPVQRFLRVLPRAQSAQRTGSAALNLAYVACGRYDGFWSSSLKPWDMAAGVLLVQEAGGRVSRVDGRPLVLEVPDLLAAATPELHAELGEELRRAGTAL